MVFDNKFFEGIDVRGGTMPVAKALQLMHEEQEKLRTLIDGGTLGQEKAIGARERVKGIEANIEYLESLESMVKNRETVEGSSERPERHFAK